jgi:CRISPR-associated protein Cas2
MKYLITYDIRNPKRWVKVYKSLKKLGLNVQLSCFEVDLSEYMMDQTLKKLSKYIDSKEDLIYAYPLSERSSSFIVKLGKAKDLNFDYIL